MTYTYEQATGKLIDPDGHLVATGYAGGNCGKNPSGVNNPAMQECHGVGPLPVGLYALGQPENSPHLGPYAIPLIPHPGNTMYARSGFYIHGDMINGPPHSASEGCIIVPRAIREELSASGDTITVVSGLTEQPAPTGA
jgi:hypothetical protein